MNDTQVLSSIEGFLKQHVGKDYCMGCIIKYARIARQEDQVIARHVLLTSNWGKRVTPGMCIRCDKIADVWQWEFPGLRLSTDKP